MPDVSITVNTDGYVRGVQHKMAEVNAERERRGQAQFATVEEFMAAAIELRLFRPWKRQEEADAFEDNCFRRRWAIATDAERDALLAGLPPDPQLSTQE